MITANARRNIKITFKFHVDVDTILTYLVAICLALSSDFQKLLKICTLFKKRKIIISS